MIIERIETERLVIRNFTPDDANDLYEILGDAETMKHCEPAYDFKKTKDFLHSFCITRNGAVAAVHKQSKKTIGYILCNEIDPGIYEMGWFFNRRYWRQGYATEACKAVLDHAFRDLHAHKVFAETLDGVKSVGLMQKLGMQFEGVQRGQTNSTDGNPASLYLYGLLAANWKPNQTHRVSSS